MRDDSVNAALSELSELLQLPTLSFFASALNVGPVVVPPSQTPIDMFMPTLIDRITEVSSTPKVHPRVTAPCPPAPELVLSVPEVFLTEGLAMDDLPVSRLGQNVSSFQDDVIRWLDEVDTALQARLTRPDVRICLRATDTLSKLGPSIAGGQAEVASVKALLISAEDELCRDDLSILDLRQQKQRLQTAVDHLESISSLHYNLRRVSCFLDAGAIQEAVSLYSSLLPTFEVLRQNFDCANDLMPAVHSIKLRTLNCIAQQLAEASCESREEAEEFDAYRLPYPLHVPCTCRSRSGRVPVFRRWSDGPAVVDLVNSVLSLNAGLQEFLHLLSPEKQFLMDIAKSLSLPTSASDSLACRISSAVAKLSPCRFLRSVSMAFCPLLLSHLRMIRALGCLVLDAAHEEHQHLFSFVSKAVKAILDAFGVLLLSRGQAWEATLQRQLVQGGLPAAREYLLVESSLLGSVSWTLLKVYHELLSENTQDVRIPLDAAHDVKAVAKSSLAALRALMLNRSRQLLDHFSRSYCVPLLEESLECEKWERQVSLAGSKLERLVQSKCVPLLGGDRDLIPANGLQFESDGPERCTTISVLRFVSAITDLLDIAQMLPVAMADAGSRAAELTTMFNSEANQLVLGGRAIKLGVLQSATATNLCHAYCSLLIVSDSVSRAVERLERSTCPQLKSTCTDIPVQPDEFSQVTSSEFLRPYFAFLHMFDKTDQAPPPRNHSPVTTGLFDSPREPDISAPLHYRFWVERTMSSKKETRVALLMVQDHQQRLTTKLSDILSERFEETLLRGWVSASSWSFYTRPLRDSDPDDRVTRTSKNMDLIHPAVLSVVKDTKIMFSIMHRLLELPTAQANLIRAVSDCVRKAETICKHLEWTAEDFGEEEEQTLLTRRVADCKAVKPLLARSTVLQAVSSEQQFQTTVEQLSEALRLHTLQSYRSYKKGETELLNTAQFRQAKTSMTAWWKKVNDRMKPPKSPVGVKLPNET